MPSHWFWWSPVIQRTADPVGMDQQLPCIHVLKTVDKRNVCVGGGSGKPLGCITNAIWHAFQCELGVCFSVHSWFRQLHRQGGLFPTCCTYSPTDAKKIVAGCYLFEVLVWIHPKFIKLSTHVARLLRNMTARKNVLLLVISATVGSDGSVQLFFDKAGEEASGHPTIRSLVHSNMSMTCALYFYRSRCAESLEWL